MHPNTAKIFGFILLGTILCGLVNIAPAAAAEDAMAAGSAVEETRTVNGIRLMALTPAANALMDISILPPTEGLDHIGAALTLIAEKSPRSVRAIKQLRDAGLVTIVYYPNNFRDHNRLNTQTVALFLPDFLKKRGMGNNRREFTVVVNQFGVKWPTAELAAVIVHELAGHGIQHLEGRIRNARLLDLECEASLFQEQAYQDFGVAKKLRTVVLFRRQMEYHYCADFRDYMRDRTPAKLAIWDALNPNIPGLLDMFRSYRGIQTAQQTGVAGAPVTARSR